MSLCELIAAFT